MHMSTTDHLILILLSMVVAFLPRFIPLRIFSRRQIPEWFNEWMQYIPVSLFTALVVKDIFIDTSHGYLITFDNYAKMLAAIVVGFIAARTRSMGLSVIIGLIAVALLTWAL